MDTKKIYLCEGSFRSEHSFNIDVNENTTNIPSCSFCWSKLHMIGFGKLPDKCTVTIPEGVYILEATLSYTGYNGEWLSDKNLSKIELVAGRYVLDIRKPATFYQPATIDLELLT